MPSVSNTTHQTQPEQPDRTVIDLSADHGDGRLESEEIFDILSNSRRRVVLQHLQDTDNRSDLRTLTERVAAWENDVAPEKITNKQRMRAYTALRQSHLPKMDEKGIIEFDPDRGTVELEQHAAEVDEYIARVLGQDDPWIYVFLGIGAMGTLATVGSLVDLSLFAGIHGSSIALLVSAAIILAATTKLGYETITGSTADVFTVFS